MANSEPMAPVDTTWLRMDRPANPMVITGILILEGPVDLNAVESTLTERMLAIPRFRQRIVTHGLEHAWADDPDLDPGRHVRRTRLPGKGGRTELEKLVGRLASEQIDKAHPPWQMHIVEHYEGGAAVIVRIHHAIADGIALIGVMLSLTDDAASRRHRYSDDRDRDNGDGGWLLGTVPRLVRKGLGVPVEAWREAVELASTPSETLRKGVGVAAELAYLLFMPSDTRTRFKGKPRGSKRVAWTDPIKLPEVKVVAKVLGCSINDMLLASVAGALHDYLAARGDATEGVEVRALVPVNLRSPADMHKLGNSFGIVGVELPVGLENPLARLAEVSRRMHALKSSLEPPVTLGLLTALGYAPRVVQDKLFDLLLSRATAVMTNVPGPQHPLHLGGALIRQIMFWVPQSGDIGMGVSILSFNGHVQLGLMTDAALVPDPQAIIDRFQPEFEQLLYYVLMGAWEGHAPDSATERKASPANGSAASKAKRKAAKPATASLNGSTQKSGKPKRKSAAKAPPEAPPAPKRKAARRAPPA